MQRDRDYEQPHSCVSWHALMTHHRVHVGNEVIRNIEHNRPDCQAEENRPDPTIVNPGQDKAGKARGQHDTGSEAERRIETSESASATLVMRSAPIVFRNVITRPPAHSCNIGLWLTIETRSVSNQLCSVMIL